MLKAKAIQRREKTTSMVNPRRKSKRALGAPRAKKTSNPGSLFTLGVLNPQRRKTVQKSKATKAKRTTKRRVAQNPFVGQPIKAVARRKTRRNPSQMSGIMSKPLDMARMAAYAAIGLIATRQAPQLALGEKNKGPVGYIANFATAIGTAAVVTKTIGREAGVACLIGGSLYAFNRLLNDFTPLGRQLNLSNLGDVHAFGGLGALVPAYFPYPVVTRAGQPVIPQGIVNGVRAALPAPALPAPASAKAGMSGGRFGR